MAAISQTTASDNKEFSQQSTEGMSCSQSPVQEVGDNAKEIGGFEKSQLDDKLAQKDYSKLYEGKANILLSHLNGLNFQDANNVIELVVSKLPRLCFLETSLPIVKTGQ